MPGAASKRQFLNMQAAHGPGMARKNKPLIVEIGEFLWERKLWWIIPVIIMLILIGIIIVFSQTSSVSPFIYAFV